MRVTELFGKSLCVLNAECIQWYIQIYSYMYNIYYIILYILYIVKYIHQKENSENSVLFS